MSNQQSIANKILSGNNGTMWFNGTQLATLTKIEAKAKGNFEDVTFCDDNGTYQRYNGWSGEGTFTCKKIDSTVLKLVADAYKTGVMPEITIITRVTDKSTDKNERTSIEGVVITEFALANFETKKMLEEEFPFKFSDFEVLETI